MSISSAFVADEEDDAADDDDDDGFPVSNPVSFPVPNPKSNHDRMACRAGFGEDGSTSTNKATKGVMIEGGQRCVDGGYEKCVNRL